MRSLYLTYTSPPCRAVLMTLSALQLDAEKRPLNMLQREQHSQWFLELNPRHCVPTLDDDGFILWESRSIMRYLVDTYGSDDALYPRNSRQRALVDRILDFDLGHLYKAVLEYARPQIFELAETDNDKKKKTENEIAVLDQLLREQGGGWLVADRMTIADVSIITSLSLLECVDFDLTAFKSVEIWREKLKSLEIYQINHKQFEEWKNFAKTPKWKEMMQLRLSK